MVNIHSRGLNFVCSISINEIKNIKSKLFTYKIIILDIKTFLQNYNKFGTKSTHFEKPFSRCVIFKTKLTHFEKKNHYEDTTHFEKNVEITNSRTEISDLLIV